MSYCLHQPFPSLLHKKWINLTSQELKNTLLSLEYYPIEKDLQSVLLSVNNDISKQKNTTNNVFLISDYQNVKSFDTKIVIDTTTTYNFIQLQPAKKTNVSIDSVYISSRTNETITLKAIIKSFNTSANKTPVSLYDENVLLGKSTVDITLCFASKQGTHLFCIFKSITGSWKDRCAMFSLLRLFRLYADGLCFKFH